MAIIEKYYILSDSTHRKRKILMYKCECDMWGVTTILNAANILTPTRGKSLMVEKFVLNV